MQKKTLLFGASYFLLATAILNYLAISLYLYWTVWWFDILVHILGGISATLFISWLLLSFFHKDGLRGESTLFFLTLLGVFSLGVIWEIFEYSSGITFASANYKIGTMKDLSMNLVGGFFACTYLHFWFLPKRV